MKTMKNRALRCLAGLAFTLLLGACSFERDPSKILAVEVGNPEDANPGKPAQPRPLRLLQVELQTTDLEEIAQIDFAVQNVTLVMLSSSGKEVVVASNNLKAGSQLTLIPKSIQSLYFSVPAEALENNPQLKIQMKFMGDNPGSVQVDSQQFSIAPQTQPLHIALPGTKEARVSEQTLVISKPIDKSSLFSYSAPSVPDHGGVGPSRSSGTAQPTPIPSPVYKLKGS
ncbi:MAG: hypothetical protein RI932_522 [Pseudomonadota bacterium]|jgi:hypothetical protein